MTGFTSVHEALAEIRLAGSDTEYESARSAAATEFVGVAVARSIRDAGVTAVVSLMHFEDVVLAHIVARELGAQRATVEEDLGLLTLSPALPAESRVAFVAFSQRSPRDVAGATSLLRERGFELIDPVFAAELP